MRGKHCEALVADESGAATIWSLFWFLLMIGFAGLAVDGTDGLRNRTMLQATADSAALAGAIDLPDAGAAVDTAVAYASANMTPGVHGEVLDESDVIVGRWDPDKNTMQVGHPIPDAVWVTTWRGEENANPIGLTFLRLTGLEAWNVRAQAVAQRYIPDCIRDGLIARGIVDISANNDFVKYICVHGQQGVHMQNHNDWQYGTTVSMPNYHEMLEIPATGMESNPGLPEALRENILDPRMVNHIDAIMQGLLDREEKYLPAYTNPSPPVIEVDETFDFTTAKEGRIYHVQCEPNKQVKLPSDTTLRDLVIVSDCNIHIGSKAKLIDVFLASRSGQPGKLHQANITMASNVQLGEPDGCTDGGGVQIFSNASIHTASKTTIDGVQMVAAGDIELTAKNNGVNGISAQSGRDITMTSNNIMGLCIGGVPDLFTVPYYRLVL